MRRIVAVLQSLGLLPDPSGAFGAGVRAAVYRKLFGNRCPLCAGALSGHRIGAFATLTVDGERVADRYAARDAVLAQEAHSLGSVTGISEPGDIVSYAVLECPNVRKAVVVEHFSGLDMLSEESVVMLPDVTSEKIRRFESEVTQWLLL
jgi:hypothetical protein